MIKVSLRVCFTAHTHQSFFYFSSNTQTGCKRGKDVPAELFFSSRSVKFNKGYAALSQTGEDSLVPLDSDSDAELDCSSGYSSAEVHPDLSRQLLKDGYHLDEIPDDEDLDLIPPKALSSSSVCCCCCCVQ
uniref:Family with sequence similarity 219 member B n=1 Tax=Sinocyclocheilus anshuiensis TaxID=1608454 RepID=A0A671K2G4_9TELE